ncbi:MAG: anaerobic sulfite reductase subunit AsrB [Eubacteriales bacterium]
MENHYIPFASKILEVIPHTAIEYTFRMEFVGDVKPGQFFEVSIPKYGESPISVSGIGSNFIDLTIRKVGKVTNEIFENMVGDSLFLRGPYGNGFDVSDYAGGELVVMAGGTGVSPVRGVIQHFADHPEQVTNMTLIAGFKSVADMLFKADFKVWKDKMDTILTIDSGEETADVKVGLVTKYIPDLDVKNLETAKAIVVGPPMMMKFGVQALIARGFREENIWISQERKMCCGLGKCGHCRIGDVYICVDGPVFNYTKGRALID